MCVTEMCKVMLNCTLVQALRLCTGRTTHRESRSIAVLFLDRGTRSGQRHAPAALYRHSGSAQDVRPIGGVEL